MHEQATSRALQLLPLAFLVWGWAAVLGWAACWGCWGLLPGGGLLPVLPGGLLEVEASMSDSFCWRERRSAAMTAMLQGRAGSRGSTWFTAGGAGDGAGEARDGSLQQQRQAWGQAPTGVQNPCGREQVRGFSAKADEGLANNMGKRLETSCLLASIAAIRADALSPCVPITRGSNC